MNIVDSVNAFDTLDGLNSAKDALEGYVGTGRFVMGGQEVVDLTQIGSFLQTIESGAQRYFSEARPNEVSEAVYVALEKAKVVFGRKCEQQTTVVILEDKLRNVKDVLERYLKTGRFILEDEEKDDLRKIESSLRKFETVTGEYVTMAGQTDLSVEVYQALDEARGLLEQQKKEETTELDEMAAAFVEECGDVEAVLNDYVDTGIFYTAFVDRLMTVEKIEAILSYIERNVDVPAQTIQLARARLDPSVNWAFRPIKASEERQAVDEEASDQEDRKTPLAPLHWVSGRMPEEEDQDGFSDCTSLASSFEFNGEDPFSSPTNLRASSFRRVAASPTPSLMSVSLQPLKFYGSLRSEVQAYDSDYMIARAKEREAQQEALRKRREEEEAMASRDSAQMPSPAAFSEGKEEAALPPPEASSNEAPNDASPPVADPAPLSPQPAAQPQPSVVARVRTATWSLVKKSFSWGAFGYFNRA